MIDILKRALRNALVAFTLIVSLFILLEDWMSRDVDPDAVRQNSGNTVLFDHRGECWADGQEAHVDVPTHVIMRIEDGIGGGHWQYLGPKYVDIALNDVFKKNNPRVFVRAFCE